MSSMIGKSPVVWQKPHGRHIPAAIACVALSVLLHGVMVRYLPPFPVGKPPETRALDKYRPMAIGDVRRMMEDLPDDRDRYRADDPGRATQAAFDSEAFRGFLDRVAPVQSDPIDTALAGERDPLAGMEGDTADWRWDPRSDLMDISDRIVPDEAGYLPRRLIPDIERTHTAPDVVLPAESAEYVRTARAATVDSLFPDDELGVVGDPAADGRRMPSWFAGSGTRSDALSALEGLDLIQDPDDDVGMEGIEQLLELDIETHVDPDDPGNVYFRMEVGRRGEEALPIMPRDVLLIQDCSASMTQRLLDKSKEGLLRILNGLRPGDRFDIVRFADDTEVCFGKMTPVSPVSVARSNWFINDMRAQGSTDVFASLEPALSLDTESGRPIIAILVTDGIPTTGLIDTSDIIGQFSKANMGEVAVFTVGAGRRVNEYLVDFISFMNRGDALIVEERAELPKAMERLGMELSRPVLTHLSFRSAGHTGLEVYPRSLTHLYLDRPLVLYGRFPSEADRIAFQIVGRSSEGLKDMVFKMELSDAHSGDQEIRKGWARQKAYDMISEHIRTGDDTILRYIAEIVDAHDLGVPYARQILESGNR